MDKITQNITFQRATTENLDMLLEEILDFNVTAVKDVPRGVLQRLDFMAKDSTGKLIGGIKAQMTNWGNLEVNLLVVFENYRRMGIGSLLLNHVEGIARNAGCHIVHLDTFDFQAKDFYLKHGYEVFGILENSPKGHRRYYLSKKLD